MSKHPIISKLPIIYQALHQVKPTRGRTVAVDAQGNVITAADDSVQDSSFSNQGWNAISQPEPGENVMDANALAKPIPVVRAKITSDAIWKPECIGYESSSSEEDQELSSAAQASVMPYSAATAVMSGGFKVVEADSRYVAGMAAAEDNSCEEDTALEEIRPYNRSRTAVGGQNMESSDADSDSADLIRTGIISGNVTDRIKQFNITDQSSVTKDSVRYQPSQLIWPDSDGE